ncbi:MAG: pitrilysin family protein [candidate division WOR-3 bacterium]
MDNYKKSVLSSGVTVCSEFVPYASSVAIGIFVVVGSRDEKKEKEGISHFTEHAVFKGTKTRTEREISFAIESRGGYLNASTSREWTSLYAHVLPEDLELAVDVLGDMVENPLFLEEDLDAEREIILQEIKMVNDSPENLVFDYSFKSTFGEEHPLSRFILGREESVKSINRNDILEFWGEHWSSNRIFVSAAGKVSHENLCSLIEKRIKRERGNNINRFSPLLERVSINIIPKRELKHKYVVLSSSSFPYTSNLRFGLLIAGTILGSGMSSLLFQRLRQELNYVYEVSTFSEFFTDTGIFGIYFSTDRLKETLNATKDLLGSLEFTEEEVNSAKNRLKGNILISLESIDNKMERNIKEEIYGGRRSSILELLNKIENVSMEEIKTIVDHYLRPENLVLTVLGEAKNVSW